MCQHTEITFQWRAEDIARAKYRLSLLLRRQNKPREAATYEQQADILRSEQISMLHGTDGPESNSEKLDEETKMALFDLGVSCWHGRTAGIWKAGDYW